MSIQKMIWPTDATRKYVGPFDIKFYFIYTHYMQSHIDAFYKNFGKLIQEKRKEAGLTQEIVAESLGINRATLANLEAGDHRMLAHHYFELCLILKLNPNDLFSEYKIEKMKQRVQFVPESVQDVIQKVRNSKQGGEQ